MIKLAEKSLSARTAKQLSQYQHSIDNLPDYAERVKRAKRDFSSRNKRGNRAFDEIKVVLDSMCSGSRRCMYCEDSAADEVEHIHPKDLYPERTFDWENYLYICGPCNTGKNNKFSVFDSLGQAVSITRSPKSPVIPPISGEAIFINPRSEDAMRFLVLDLLGTFQFVPHPGIDSKDRLRAEFTRDVLSLNRDVLIESRREAYGSYIARLEQYISHKKDGAELTELKTLIDALQRMQHPTVWQEMKRLKDAVPRLKKLFDAEPEALSW
jgi:uncharacterized protein (TIGR02646 family)